MDNSSLDSSAELNPQERLAFAAWARVEIPIDFADRVADEVSLPRVTASSRRVESRAMPWGITSVGAVAFVAAVAAAVLLWVLPQVPKTDAESVAPQVVVEGVRTEVLRDEASALLAQHCSPCHDGEAGGVEQGALAVFDVRDPQWWTSMSRAQLDGVVERMVAREVPSSEVAEMSRFVEAEFADRDARG